MVFKYHPDNKEGDKAKDICNKQMMVINAAYKVLKDVDLRGTYDKKRQMGQYGSSAGVKVKYNSYTQTKSTSASTKQASKVTSTYTSSAQSSQQKSSDPSFKNTSGDKNSNIDDNDSLFNVI